VITSNGRKIQEQILALLGSANYRPLNKSELAKALGRKSGVRMGLSQVLRDLERAGEIARIRKNRYVLPPAADLIAGKLHIHQAGYGFLISENRASQTFSLRQKTPEQPCMATVWLRAYRGMNLIAASKDGAKGG